MTLKDQFNIKGFDSTLGYVGRAFKPAAEDAVLVKILEDAGAVILAKTNLPQSIMVLTSSGMLRLMVCLTMLQWCETENPLWGLTTHPLNADLTPGGSTGGEGALLALRGSMMGWGTVCTLQEWCAPCCDCLFNSLVGYWWERANSSTYDWTVRS